jgi:hypothetical protein
MQCKDCKGTGVYRGISEPKKVGVICTDCKGTGNHIIVYTPFAERLQRDDVEIVRNGFDSKKTVTYEEFLAGKMPN